MAAAVLKRGAGREFKAGGPWIYDNEVDRVEGSFENGDVVELHDFDGFFLGYGIINVRSKIRVRIMSRKREHPITEELIGRRVKDAWEHRKQIMVGYVHQFLLSGSTIFDGGEPDASIDESDGRGSDQAVDIKAAPDINGEVLNNTDCSGSRGVSSMADAYKRLSCRLIFGEADFLPGITIDKFSDVLVIESLALGTDRMKELIIDKCKKVLAEDGVIIRGVYERSDAKVRELEGLERTKGFIGEPFDTKVLIEENGVKYFVDVENGQKTGFFLDQKFNRQAIGLICRGKKVLDCFTHTGSFALNAAAGGAVSVLGVDASDLGCEQARENAALNGFEKTVTFKCADVFELLPELERKGEQFDVVILDPPAFTKSRASIKKAVTGYKEINLRGMRLVKDGGYLATCSCSHFMDEELFLKTIADAARDAHKRLKQVEFRQQAMDHPILWGGSSSYYLKFVIFQVCDEM